jgi:hypothetical protein
MPTPTCHSLSNILSGMFHTTSDKVALLAAGVASSAPLFKDHLQHVNEYALMLGPTLAGVFVVSKIVLTWVQISKELRRKPGDDG